MLNDIIVYSRVRHCFAKEGGIIRKIPIEEGKQLLYLRNVRISGMVGTASADRHFPYVKYLPVICPRRQCIQSGFRNGEAEIRSISRHGNGKPDGVVFYLQRVIFRNITFSAEQIIIEII